MSSLVKVIEQADQDRTLFCEICGHEAGSLRKLPDFYGAEPLNACLTCFLKDMEAA